MKKPSIAFKLSLYFALTLLAFALVVGSVFFVLFKKQSVEVNKKQLESRAVAIADTFGTFLENSQETAEKHSGQGRGNGTGNGTGNGAGGMGYQAYVRFLDDIAMADVWVVDSDHNLVTPTHNNHETEVPQTYNYADLPADAESVVDKAFGGEITTGESFSSLLNSATLTVGAPIKAADGSVSAVVLLHSPVEVIERIPDEGLRTLIISLGIALVLGVLMAVVIGHSFTKPMKEMQVMAGRLANGDYTAKSHVTRQDEIGSLARSLDKLSLELDLSREEHERFAQMQQDFFSSISHELKTPVTVLCGSLEALSTGVVSDPELVADYHRQMYGESLALKRLVNDLLDLSRLQSTEFRLNMEVVNLCDILREAKRSVQSMAAQRDIEVTAEMDTTVYFMAGDYLRLRQLMTILLGNAVKFSDPNTQIRMALKDNCLQIKDQGRGIDAEALPHIFERFYKTLSKQNAEGTGLGLSIAKEIADRHQIQIQVESILEKGTTFTLTLPQKQMERNDPLEVKQVEG